MFKQGDMVRCIHSNPDLTGGCEVVKVGETYPVKKVGTSGALLVGRLEHTYLPVTWFELELLPHEWKVGDRAHIFTDQRDGTHNRYLNKGKVFTVEWIKRLASDELQIGGHADDGQFLAPYADRCKPVVRVKAPSRQTPAYGVGPSYAALLDNAATYAELRLAHGPSHYQTGHDVFKGWGPATAVPKYEELGN